MSELLVSESPEHVVSEPLEPWWHYTDWFEGLSIPEITKRLQFELLAQDTPRPDYVVVPRIYLDNIDYYTREEVGQQVAAGLQVAALAERIYMALLQREGYGTQHVQRAWEQAEAFAARAAGGAGVSMPSGGGR